MVYNNNGSKPYEQMDDLGGKNHPYFWKHPIRIDSPWPFPKPGFPTSPQTPSASVDQDPGESYKPWVQGWGVEPGIAKIGGSIIYPSFHNHGFVENGCISNNLQ